MKASSNVTCMWIYAHPVKAGELLGGSVGRCRETGAVVSLNTGPSDLSPLFLSLSLSSANKPFHFLSGKSVLHNITHTELEWESGKTPRRGRGSKNLGNFPDKKTWFLPYFHSMWTWLASNDEHWLCVLVKDIIEGSLSGCWWSDAKQCRQIWDYTYRSCRVWMSFVLRRQNRNT